MVSTAGYEVLLSATKETPKQVWTHETKSNTNVEQVSQVGKWKEE